MCVQRQLRNVGEVRVDLLHAALQRTPRRPDEDCPQGTGSDTGKVRWYVATDVDSATHIAAAGTWVMCRPEVLACAAQMTLDIPMPSPSTLIGLSRITIRSVSP